MKNYDWSRFTQKIPVHASLQRVYDQWCIPRKLEKWFLRAASFTEPDGSLRNENTYVQPGDTYTWRWYGYADSVEESGEVFEANGRDRFQFQFGKAGLVTVSIYTEQDTTICQLEQSNIPTDEQSKSTYHVGCMNGWNFYLANLKSILEGGIDLRNKNENLRQVLNS